MRVLMVNRPDTFTVPGGDTVQMVETASCLRSLGLDVDFGLAGQLNSLAPYDVVHVFNWEQTPPVFSAREQEPQCKARVVLSPLFMFETGHWYDAAVTSKAVWQMVNSAIGGRYGRRLYRLWQKTKQKHNISSTQIRSALEMADWLLPICYAELSAALDITGRTRDPYSRCTLIPNGVTPALFKPSRTGGSSLPAQLRAKPFVLQVARIQSEKNQLGLIQALFDTSHPIVFAGPPSPYDPDYVERCYKLASQRGNVYFLGPVPHEEIPGLYEHAAVHVLPSWREVMPLVCLEAAAAGCKIVSTTIGGVREYFGADAWYCDPGDLASIRDAVLNAYQAPSSDRLRRKVLAEFTWENAARKTLEAYESALRS